MRYRPPPRPDVPRAPREPSGCGLLLAVALLLWFSPITFLTWIGAQWAIARQTRLHWYWFAIAAMVALAVTMAAFGGPVELLRIHFAVPSAFWHYVALYLGFGNQAAPSPWSLLVDLLITQVWAGLPLGVLAAALTIGAHERRARGAEWHPLVQRRQLVDEQTRERRVRRLLARASHRLSASPPLGVALDGDLSAWRDGRYAVVPYNLSGKAMAVVGAPGSGKTVTLLRLAYIAGAMGRKVAFADCKGTDPNLAEQLAAAYLLGNPWGLVGRWPEEPMDMWRGAPSEIVSRLLAVQTFTEPWYERVASATLRLAVNAPGLPRIRSSADLMARLDADVLKELWAGHEQAQRDLKAIGDGIAGVRLRYADFFGALGSAFDRGRWSFEDVDLTILTVPTLLSKSEADAAMRVVLEDYGHYATGRKPQDGEDSLLIVDEFSALANGVDSAINLAERVRDVGAQVIVAAQSVQGLGDERQAARLLAACAGGVIVHQCADPEPLLRLAGSVRQVEQMWDVGAYGTRGTSRARMQDRPRVDPEQVRAARPGEAWIIQAGRALHLRVLQPPRPRADTPATRRTGADPAIEQNRSTSPLDETPLASLEEATPPQPERDLIPWLSAACAPIKRRRAQSSSGPRILGRLLHRLSHQRPDNQREER